MQRIRIAVVVLALAAFLVQCAGGRKLEKPEAKEKAALRGINEDFDPLSLNDDDLTPELEKKAEEKTPGGQEPSTTQRAPADTTQPVPGYRVQLTATTDEQTARAIFREAMLKFPESVYFVYENPYYKVRVGDYVSRAEAEALQQRAVDRGFPDAWVVRTTVRVEPKE